MKKAKERAAEKFVAAIVMLSGAIIAIALAAAFFQGERGAPVAAGDMIKENNVPQPLLPEITFFDEKGEPVTLADFRGQVVLVNLWATWCPPCVAEMPALDMLQARLRGEGVAVVAISQDRNSMDEVTAFYRDKKIDHLAAYWDKNREAPVNWEYEGLPVSFLLDRAGNVVAKYEGPYEWAGSEMLGKVRALAAMPATPTSASSAPPGPP